MHQPEVTQVMPGAKLSSYEARHTGDTLALRVVGVASLIKRMSFLMVLGFHLEWVNTLAGFRIWMASLLMSMSCSPVGGLDIAVSSSHHLVLVCQGNSTEVGARLLPGVGHSLLTIDDAAIATGKNVGVPQT